MRRLLAFLLLTAQFITSVFAAQLPAADLAEIYKAVDACNAAFLRSDAATVADFTADRMVQTVGGRDRYVALIEAGMKAVQSQGVKFVSHKVEPPTEPIVTGEFLFVVFKEVAVMEWRGRKVRNDGFTIAVRRVDGGPWKLIGGNIIKQNPTAIATLYPGFPPDYVFPKLATTLF